MHAGEQSKSILTQQYANDRIPIYHGVTQITNFTNNSGFADYPIRTFESENKSGIIAAEEYYTWRINDAVEAMNVYLDLIYADEVTYVDRNGKVARDDNPYSTIKQFSPVDVDAAPIGAQLPLPELCVNRHPNCALWSVIGQCDGSVQLMSRQCSAMCQNCDTNLVRPDGIYFEQNLWIQSPFQRDDLMGVFESIMQDRIVVYVQYRKEHFPNNMKVESRKSNSHLNYLNFEEIPVDPIIVRRNHKDEEIYRKALKSNGSGPRVATMLRLNKFLSKEDCQGVLDTVSFGVGVNAHKNAQTDKDGFPKKSGDLLKTGENDSTIPSLARSNARVALFPSIKDKFGVMRYSNAIERLLIKISLLTGIVAAEKIEAPIVFEKYEYGDMQVPSSHFKNSILNNEKRYFPPEDIPVRNGDQYYGHGVNNEIQSDEPNRMENARLFGLTIFLTGSGLAEDGGQIYFPKMNNVEIFPLEGNAILFPTVASLVPQDADVSGEKTGALDELLDTGGDSSFLVEELATMFGHKSIAKSSKGPKYCVTLYFRRYEDDNRLPK
jgi:hypothetical protein